MDDIIVRSRYPRHSGPVRRRHRNTRGEVSTNRTLIKQVLISIIILVLILIIKSIDTPVTNFLTDKVKESLVYSIDIQSVYEGVISFFGGETGNEEDGGNDAFNGDAVPVSAGGNATGGHAGAPNLGEIVLLTPVSGSVASGFGKRTDIFTNTDKMHYGIDIKAENGAEIKAVLGGVVADTGSSSTYGSYLRIDHGDGLYTVYAHCLKLEAQTGATVKQGDVIASVGNAGRSVGTHLHFEIWKDGTALDPLNYMDLPLS